MSRRQPVASGGGMMSSAKVTPVSKETQDMMKVMMKEAKLTATQQRQLNDAMKAGRPLPSSLPPDGRYRPHVPAAAKSSVSKKPAAARGVRSKDAIVSSGAYNQENVLPSVYVRPVDAERKDKLQVEMAYDGTPGPRTKNYKGGQEPPAPPPEVDRFDEVLGEIEERKRFLAEMESVGRAGQYRHIINHEISQKILELTAIDRQRSKEVADRLKPAPSA